MDILGDDRGQSVQIGFILIFGILVITLSIFQGAIVPNQNRTVEFNHYQEVRDDMTVLYTEIVSLGSSSRNGQVLTPVTLGTRHPARLMFINPPPAIGTLQSSGQKNITIETNTGGNSIAAADICGGATSTGLVYSPEYQESTLPQIRYDNGLLYVETAGGEYAMLENRVVVNESAQQVNIYRTTGQLEAKSEVGVLPIELTGTDMYGEDTSVQLDGTSEVVLPSNLPASEWNDATALRGSVTATQNSSNTVALTGFSDRDYTIRCYTTGLGERPDPPSNQFRETF
ncbi:hypothetical protein GCM10008995_27270 [Halobellus salinus]|uniref:Uncharacterized protein n=1 Tax=Halobellus salinus TaxID=931585 RepID=A0A830EDS4_9EURY|nr:hypothetical protein [Halobellus salinus]GGJ15983.1 hypothetical protein GCM10008995_27270 [Halobellus salinus]SMP31353.1 hypothetical protein SAMN06265347_1182 [Halobellus salinus]